MVIGEIDNTDMSQSEKIREILFDSYSVEGKLIGVSDFPPLRRTSGDIRIAQTKFIGCMSIGRLVAVAELEMSDPDELNIASFGVHPTVFRRGIGSNLLRHILQTYGHLHATVSTAIRNRPAVTFYEKHGFRLEMKWCTECGIDMVNLVWDSEA
ncbi:MAG: GNAT family N-acetyltransferase [Candidatus Fermentibacteria bacterium]